MREARLAPNRDAGRRAQIDGLRAIAMLGVLYVHFWDAYPLPPNLRVSLFFVVSGFLITQMLLAAGLGSRRVIVANYYVRRALRLFPALFILVVVGVAFDAEGVRNSILWHLFHLSNVYFSIHGTFAPWVFAHLWSLNTLEQFYLLAPLLILLLPRHGLVACLVGLLVLAIVTRNAWPLVAGRTSLWPALVFSFDPVITGALACLLTGHARFNSAMRSRYAVVASLLLLALPLLLQNGFGSSEVYRLAMQPPLAVIVVGAYTGHAGPVGALLQSPLARFLSRISYGVFVYHLMVWWLLGEMFPSLYLKGPRTFLVVSSATVIVATISWYLVERPIAQLKQRFPTTGPVPAHLDVSTTAPVRL